MKWISVEKKKPKTYHPVLATDGKHLDILWLVDEYYLMDKPTGQTYWSPIKRIQYFNGEINLKNITHWMEFPELPAKKVFCKKCKHWKPIKKCCSIQRPNINHDCIDYENKEKK